MTHDGPHDARRIADDIREERVRLQSNAMHMLNEASIALETAARLFARSKATLDEREAWRPIEAHLRGLAPDDPALDLDG